MFLNRFLLVDQKNFFDQSKHFSLLFLGLEEFGAIKKTKYWLSAFAVILD